MISSYLIRNIEVRPNLVLSPMSGVTTGAFRRLVKELNPGAVGLLVSEFISVEAMTRQVPRSLAMMKFCQEERPYAIQIFGYDVNRLRDAALMCQDAGVDLVDINCGCPAPKVVRRGGGCELMRQPEHLKSIFREVRAALKIPLTMKMRSGWDESCRNAVEIARIAEGEGLEAITVHGRTRAQLYRGMADWSLVEEVAAAVRIPVLGSGDVVDRATAEARLQGKIAGLFIGRGALVNPFIFSEIVDGQKRDLRHEPLTAVSVLERYVELLREEFPPKACIGKIKQLAAQMGRGFTWRREICRAETLDAQCEIIRRAREQGGGLERSVCRDEEAQAGATQEEVEVLST